MLNDPHVKDGTLITAGHQISGRGQRDRTWHSGEDRDITASYILRPTFINAERQFALGATVALALHATLSELCGNINANISIKWPNDILIGTEKVAGILIENSLRGSMLDTAIVGIGLNVNSVIFPKGMLATSIAIQNNRTSELKQVLNVMDRQMGEHYAMLRSLRFTELMVRYNRHLFCRGEWVPMTINGDTKRVKVLGAQDSGLLNLLHADGRVTEHAHHELQWNALDQMS